MIGLERWFSFKNIYLSCTEDANLVLRNYVRLLKVVSGGNHTDLTSAGPCTHTHIPPYTKLKTRRAEGQENTNAVLWWLLIHIKMAFIVVLFI